MAAVILRMVSYKRLGPADASLLAEIGGISLLESHGHSAPAPVMQAYADRNFNPEACGAELAEAATIFWAVYVNDQPAGYFKIILQSSHPMVPLQPVTKLERLYLLKEFYGLGLGQGLLKKAIKLSKKAGDKGIWLDVWKKNDRALRFYEKEGFETVGESRFVLTETYANPIWVMLREYHT